MRKTFKVQTADKRMLFNNVQMENLVEQAEAHVIVLLLGLFLLLLLLGGLEVERGFSLRNSGHISKSHIINQHKHKLSLNTPQQRQQVQHHRQQGHHQQRERRRRRTQRW